MKKASFEMLKKIVLISLVVTGISFILVVVLHNVTVIWSIARIIFFIGLIIYFISLILCVITAKKNGQKLEGWINVVEILTIAIVVVFIIGYVVNADINRQRDNKTKQLLQQWEN